MPNLSSLVTGTTAALSLANLVLVTPLTSIFGSKSIQGYQPQNQPPVDGQPAIQNPPNFLFHYEGEQSAKFESDITDNYVEDNTARQDQIALRPEKVTTHGFIGELNDIAPSFLLPVQQVANKLTTIGAYAPQLSATAQLAYDEALAAYQLGANAVNSGVALWSSLFGSPSQSVINGQGIAVGSNQNRQQQAFNYFYGYWRARALFTVQTPWAVFTNMALESCTPVQDADTNQITEFQLTFKLIRVAQTSTGPANKSGQSPWSAQSSGNAFNGSQSLTQNISLTGSSGLGSYPSLGVL